MHWVTKACASQSQPKDCRQSIPVDNEMTGIAYSSADQQPAVQGVGHRESLTTDGAAPSRCSKESVSASGPSRLGVTFMGKDKSTGAEAVHV